MPDKLKAILLRISITGVIGLLLGYLISEVAFQALRSESDREPAQIELVIPEGTADLIASGEPVSGIPKDMVFMLGDTLVVRNEDRVSHQLGPIWVPAGTSASLIVDEADNYIYSCSFTDSQFLGLDVRRPVTNSTRIQAILAVGFPTTAMLAIYSFILFPLKSRRGA